VEDVMMVVDDGDCDANEGWWFVKAMMKTIEVVAVTAGDDSEMR